MSNANPNCTDSSKSKIVANQFHAAGVFIQSLSIKFTLDKISDITAIRDLDLEVLPGEFVSLVGVSGCGKTTLLNAIAGFVPPTRGVIKIADEIVIGPSDRCGIVFQQSTLFGKTVIQNIEFGSRIRALPRGERRQAAENFLGMVGLRGQGHLYPDQLSGGMAQRVEIARALANTPGVLLLDEPLGKLDALTRLHLQGLLEKVWIESSPTVMLVTHDVEEALRLGDKIIVLTCRPCSVKEIIPIHYPRPRSLTITADKEFVEIRQHVLASLEEEYGKQESLIGDDVTPEDLV